MPQTLDGCWTCGHTKGCFHNLYHLGGTLAQRQLPCEPDTVGDNVQLDPHRLVWRLRAETETSSVKIRPTIPGTCLPVNVFN